MRPVPLHMLCWHRMVARRVAPVSISFGRPRLTLALHSHAPGVLHAPLGPLGPQHTGAAGELVAVRVCSSNHGHHVFRLAKTSHLMSRAKPLLLKVDVPERFSIPCQIPVCIWSLHLPFVQFHTVFACCLAGRLAYRWTAGALVCAITLPPELEMGHARALAPNPCLCLSQCVHVGQMGRGAVFMTCACPARVASHSMPTVLLAKSSSDGWSKGSECPVVAFGALCAAMQRIGVAVDPVLVASWTPSNS